MKKNLIYYTISVKDEYVELLKKSIESLDVSNHGHMDVVILTNKEYFERNLVNFKRPNTSIFLLPQTQKKDEEYFNKLKIFSYPSLELYENVLYLDCDTIVNKDLNSIFDKCVSEEKMYVVVEDYNISNHNRIQFSLETYQYEDLDFFEKNKIYTFNSGTFMFKNSVLMKKHINNVLNIIENYSGSYFTEQSFMNYYFNTYKLTDSNTIVKDIDYKYVVNSNYGENFVIDDCIMHFLTEGGESNYKLERMSEILSRMKKNIFYSDRSLWIKDINKYIGEGKAVEIGVFQGEFSKQILKSWKGILYMVDVWKALGEEYIDSSNHSFHSDAYKLAMESIQGYEDRAIMIRAKSKIASEMFEDESLDFIFIDANHAYEFVVEDINLWFPKLKKGGMFSGHDYILMDWYNDPNFLENKKDKHIYTFKKDGTPFYNGIFGVNPAVDEFCEKMGYKVNHTGEWFATWWFIK